MSDSMISSKEATVPLSCQVLLSPEILENVFLQMRDEVVAVERVCRTWRNVIHNSPRIGQYMAYRPPTRYLPKVSDELDPDFDFPEIYYNVQSHIFPELVWYLSPQMRVKFSQGQHLTFALWRQQGVNIVSSSLRKPTLNQDAPNPRQHRFDLSSITSSPSLSKIEEPKPSWYNIQLSYPATRTLRLRMADTMHRPEYVRYHAPDWPELYTSAQVRDALQFQVSCESGITYGHLIDAFTRNYERKGIALMNDEEIGWNLRLPTDSKDCTTFIYGTSDGGPARSDAENPSLLDPTIYESELVGRIVAKHKLIGWFLVNMVVAMDVRRNQLRETRRRVPLE